MVILSLSLAGCGSVGRIRLPGLNVKAVPEAGTPATVHKSDSGVSVPLPMGSRLVMTESEAVAATPETPAQPAKKVTEIIPGAPTEYRQTEASVAASTGTVDTTVRKHELDIAERRWLLWTAIGCGIAGILSRSLIPAWPALSNGLLMGAALAFASWKFSEIPAWAWLAVLAGVGLMVAGYKRAEWDKDGDGTPDFLQRK